MGELSEEISLTQSPEAVLACLSDMTRFKHWLPAGWDSYEPITQTLVGKGSRTYFSLPVLGLTLSSELEITESTLERVRWAIAAPPLAVGLLFHLSPRGSGVDVRLQLTWRTARLAPWRVRTQARVKMYGERDLKMVAEGIMKGLAQELESQPKNAKPLEEEPVAQPPRKDNFVFVRAAAEIPAGTGCPVEAFGTTIAVFNIDGHWHAIDNDCPHREGPLAQGQLDGHVVTCPLHRWRFDVTDGSCLDQPHHPTRTWPVKVEDGTVFVGPRA